MDDRENQLENPAGENALLTPFQGSAKDAVDRYTHCVLCGANLHFTHSTDFGRNLTHETAKCPECGIRAQSTLHRLQ